MHVFRQARQGCQNPENANLNCDTVPKSESRKPGWRPGGSLRNAFSYLRKRRLASDRSTSYSRRRADFHRRHGCRSQRPPDRPVGGWDDHLQRIVSRLSSLCHHSPLSSSAVRARVWTPSGSVRSPRARSLFVVLRPTPRMPNAFNTVMGCTATSLSHAARERPG